MSVVVVVVFVFVCLLFLFLFLGGGRFVLFVVCFCFYGLITSELFVWLLIRYSYHVQRCVYVHTEMA